MRWSVWTGLFAILVPVAAIAGTGFRIAPEPAWVTPARLPAVAGAAADSSPGALEILVGDEQQNAAAEPLEVYRHVVARVVNEQGVDGASQFQISFDPSYQDLLLHRLRVHRGSGTVDQLDRSHVRIIQRESRLEYRVHDGALTAVVVLDDVRPGDVVELSYTIRGQNPALAGHFGDGFSLTGEWRPGGFRRRLLWKAGRPLTMQHVGTEIRPQVTEGPDHWEYAWTPERPVKVESDGDLPSWYIPGPHVVLSSFRSWNEVAGWGAALFRVRTPPAGAVRAKVEEIRARHARAHDQALAAIRFVEDDVRYLANVLGEGSYRPSDPELVLRRRFGDCKDKVLTLVSLLRGLDIRADPALVSTTLERTILAWPPTTTIFDHAIVRIQLEGRTYWIDPTRQGQRGAALSRLHLPEYGYALVLDPAETALSEVHTSPEALPRTTIQKLFESSAAGDSARLTVETVHMGGAAEAVRLFIGGVGREDLQQRYLRYYTALYPGAMLAAPLEISDDEMLNRVRVVERYSIPEFWQVGADSVGRQADLTAFEVREYVQSPQKGKRTMPIGVTHPRHVLCETRVVASQGWSIRPESLSVTNEAVRFRYRARAEGLSLILYHEFETLADSVSAAGGEAYMRDIERIREALVFQATPGGVEDAKPAHWAGVVIALAVAGGCWVPAVRFYRRRPDDRSRLERLLAGERPSSPDAGNPAESEGPGAETLGELPSSATDPETAAAMPAEAATPEATPVAAAMPPAPLRIGGWLIVIAIGVFVNPLVVLYRMIASLMILDQRVIGALIKPWDSPFHALAAPVALFEACANTVLLVGSVLVLALFVAKRTTFPRAWIGLVLLQFLAQITSIGLSAAIPEISDMDKWKQVFATAYSAVGSTIWSLYLARSERVRKTFIR